jgi:hypothetical protein
MEHNIEQFFRADGTLVSIPVKPAKKIAVLQRLASNLSPDAKYAERELNEIFAKYYGDTAAIRRYMIEFGIMRRDKESVYWLA